MPLPRRERQIRQQRLGFSCRQSDFTVYVVNYRVAAQELDPQSRHARSPPFSTAIAASEQTFAILTHFCGPFNAPLLRVLAAPP